ncbi:MAG: SUMF1/EgtB/PvdO family nonheme iron enzyme, partial [Chlorobium sp.]
MKIIVDFTVIKNVFLTIPGWAVVGFIGKRLYTYWENWNTSNELAEYDFNASNVREKRRFFIETNGQSLPPSVENEMKSGTRNIVSEKLIPFFITNAFRKKEKDKFYLVLGDSGMGKTTFMINLYLRYNSFFNVSRKYRMRLLPFSDKGVLEKIKAIKEKMDASKTILLLDAFDEYHKLLPPETPDGLTDDERFRKVLHEVIEAVQDFREVLFTSRTQYFPNQENQIYKLEIRRPGDDGVHELVKHYLSPFSEKDIKCYLKKKYGVIPFWNYRKKQVAEEIVRKSPDLMARPMLLSYIDVFADGTAEYNNTYQIYEALVKGWIDREAKKREGENRDAAEFKLKLQDYSSKVALRLYERRKEAPSYSLSRDEATDIDAGLKDYQITGQSLLTRDAAHQWKFAHRSILEFFLAKEALENPEFAQKLVRDLAGLNMAKQFCDENGVLLRLNFVLINGGIFTMGSPERETARGGDEAQHQVKVGEFYLCKYSVTVKEYLEFTLETNSHYPEWMEAGSKYNVKTGGDDRYKRLGTALTDENHPVVGVSWDDADAYCKWRSGKTRQKFRLPTEAEWEYACRAGTSTPFNTGENLTTDQANYDGNNPYNNNPKGKYRSIPVAVDSFAPNPWDLYNMHGNVWEWCSDRYGDKYYD